MAKISFLGFIVAFIALLFAFLVMIYAWSIITRYLYEKNFSPFATIMITFVIFFIMVTLGYYLYYKSITRDYMEFYPREFLMGKIIN